MSQEYDEFQQSGAGWWIRVIVSIAYAVIIVAYGWQTFELVNWLFPPDNLFMKIVTMFVCDGCATGYAMGEMFYRFRLRRSKHLTFGMWIVTFALSTAATMIQMYLSSTHNIPHQIDPGIIILAYGLVILAFVVNILAITVIVRMEYNAAQPARRYLDDLPRRPRVQPTVQSVSLAQTETVLAPRPAPAQLAAPQPPSARIEAPTMADLDALITALSPETLALLKKSIQGSAAQDPSQAPLDQSQANQQSQQ
jgi:hypothetical protein